MIYAMRVLYSLNILEVFKWLTSPTASVYGQLSTAPP